MAGKNKKPNKRWGLFFILVAVMLICAFIPLVFGASVGPEAGLTGIIAALCYWIGDNVSYAKQDTAL